MSNENLPACPVCGEAPRYTLTFAGNHMLRCDGPIPGDSPRHTIYVLHPQLDAARALWTKAVAQQPATAAPVTDAEIETAVERCVDAGLQHGYLSSDLYDERERLLDLIARRVQQANAAAEDLARAVEAIDVYAKPPEADDILDPGFIPLLAQARTALAAFRKAQGGGA